MADKLIQKLHQMAFNLLKNYWVQLSKQISDWYWTCLQWSTKPSTSLKEIFKSEKM